MPTDMAREGSRCGKRQMKGMYDIDKRMYLDRGEVMVLVGRRVANQADIKMGCYPGRRYMAKSVGISSRESSLSSDGAKGLRHLGSRTVWASHRANFSTVARSCLSGGICFQLVDYHL